MGSRLRENVKHLFECFCEVAAPVGEKLAWISYKYPESFNDEELLKSVPKFAYPCEFENVMVQHFSFVLTSIDSKWTFGFCRHDPKKDRALVLLSSLPWHEMFYKLLSACVQACNALIYPMIWQHIYIPVLPLALMDYLLAPMPFLIGVPAPIFQRVQKNDLGDVVILDADNNTIQSPFQDLQSLPQDVVNNLRKALRNRPALLGDGVSRAFLRALVQLTAGYREALTLQQGQRITFDQNAFVESRPYSMQPFLRKMLELQIFQQFIEERLHMLNSGLGFSDEFEMEACNYSDKSGSKFMQQYREWTYAMKKEGSAFFRSVKDKANPAMKYAVKSVKDKGKEIQQQPSTSRGIRRRNRAQLRMMKYNQSKSSGYFDGQPFPEDREKSEPPGRPRQNNRSQEWRERRRPGGMRPQQAASEGKKYVARKDQETPPRDLPAYESGPAAASIPVVKVYSHNLEFSSFPYLLERLHYEMRTLHPKIDRTMPFCVFQHVCCSVLNAALITVIQSVNKETRSYLNGVVEMAQTRCQNILLPQAVIDYIMYVTTAHTADGKDIYVNIPSIAVPTKRTPREGNIPEIPAGTFGVADAHTHNVYECYVSPYVTRKYLTDSIQYSRDRQQNPNWEPLPPGLYPQGAKPNRNLLGYRELERLHPEASNLLRDLYFPNDDTLDAMIQHSGSLVANVTSTCKALAGKMKMGMMSNERKTLAGNVAFIEVTANVGPVEYLIPKSPTIWSSEPFGSNIANIAYFCGFKRKRNETASGPCYTTQAGVVLEGWNDHCNDNFLMIGRFPPVKGINDTQLQLGANMSLSSTDNRDEAISTYLKTIYTIR